MHYAEGGEKRRVGDPKRTPRGLGIKTRAPRESDPKITENEGLEVGNGLDCCKCADEKAAKILSWLRKLKAETYKMYVKYGLVSSGTAIVRR